MTCHIDACRACIPASDFDISVAGLLVQKADGSLEPRDVWRIAEIATPVRVSEAMRHEQTAQSELSCADAPPRHYTSYSKTERSSRLGPLKMMWQSPAADSGW